MKETFGLRRYEDMEEFIIFELTETDISFKLKDDTIWTRGQIVNYVPLHVDECLVGIEVEDPAHPNCSTIEYYAFSEINVRRYNFKGED